MEALRNCKTMASRKFTSKQPSTLAHFAPSYPRLLSKAPLIKKQIRTCLSVQRTVHQSVQFVQPLESPRHAYSDVSSLVSIEITPDSPVPLLLQLPARCTAGFPCIFPICTIFSWCRVHVFPIVYTGIPRQVV